MGIKDRAPEIQEHYKWYQDNFPEVADSVFIYSLGKGETPESVTEAEYERSILLQTNGLTVDEPRKEGFKSLLRENIADFSKNRSLFASLSMLENGKPLITVGVPTEQSMKAIEKRAPAFGELLSQGGPEMRSMLITYIGDQEKMHTIDLTLNRTTYQPNAEGKLSPLMKMKSEAVGEAVSTLMLLQRQQRGEFSTPVEPFLSSFRNTQSKLLLTSETSGHAMVDDSSLAVEQWAKTHEKELKNMSPREILTISHKIADSLKYPTLSEIEAFDAHRSSNFSAYAPSSPWEEMQWKQAKESGGIFVPFKNGEMLGSADTSKLQVASTSPHFTRKPGL